MKKLLLLVLTLLALQACADRTQNTPNAYLNYSGRDDLLTGGVKLIPITTPKGVFTVWTKRVGNNPAYQSVAVTRWTRRNPRIL